MIVDCCTQCYMIYIVFYYIRLRRTVFIRRVRRRVRVCVCTSHDVNNNNNYSNINLRRQPRA